MSTNYDQIDIRYLWNGDYAVSSDGDFEDTGADQIQSLIQEIQTICNSGINDWEENPNRAASLDDFVGEPNNRETARRIVDRIRTTCIGNNVVRADDLSIDVLPIDRHKVYIIISISAASTQNNSVLQDGRATVSLVYDYTEQGISFVDPSKQ